MTFRFDRARERTPVLTLVRYEAASGQASGPLSVDVVDPERTISTELSCHDWLPESELACAREDGPPVAVSVLAFLYEWNEGFITRAGGVGAARRCEPFPGG